MLTKERLGECVALWSQGKPVPDFEFDEAAEMAIELVQLRAQLAIAKEDTARLVELCKKLRGLLGPDGDYAICSSTEGEPVMRLVDAMIVGSLLEKIDAAIDGKDGV